MLHTFQINAHAPPCAQCAAELKPCKSAVNDKEVFLPLLTALRQTPAKKADRDGGMMHSLPKG